MDKDKVSLHELNKSTLIYSQAEDQGPPGKPLSIIIVIKASQRNSFQHGVRIGFFPAIYICIYIYTYLCIYVYVSYSDKDYYGRNPQFVAEEKKDLVEILWHGLGLKG